MIKAKKDIIKMKGDVIDLAIEILGILECETTTKAISAFHVATMNAPEVDPIANQQYGEMCIAVLKCIDKIKECNKALEENDLR